MTGKHKKRAFSLIEAAIVLAVVGLVLGGIWWAASSIRAEMKALEAVKMMNKIVAAYRKYAKEAPGLRMLELLDSTDVSSNFHYNISFWYSPIIYGEDVVFNSINNRFQDGIGLSGAISFGTPENSYGFIEKEQPKTCVALLKYLRTQNWTKEVPAYMSGVRFDNDSGEYVEIKLDPLSSTSDIAIACKNAVEVSFYGLYP